MSKTIFLYGPQTSGKTTRLLKIIKRDHGDDILMSGEDKARINNGREVCDVTMRFPQKWNSANLTKFKNRVVKQFPVKHVLIDGAQFWSRHQILELTKVFREIDSRIPVIFTGCRYYIGTPNQRGTEIPTSHFLLNWCDKTVPVNRYCTFCHRIATRLYISGFKHLSSHKIVAVDPRLVCDVHYKQLNCKNS